MNDGPPMQNQYHGGGNRGWTATAPSKRDAVATVATNTACEWQLGKTQTLDDFGHHSRAGPLIHCITALGSMLSYTISSVLPYLPAPSSLSLPCILPFFFSVCKFFSPKKRMVCGKWRSPQFWPQQTTLQFQGSLRTSLYFHLGLQICLFLSNACCCCC